MEHTPNQKTLAFLSGYHTAAVCTRGHVVTARADRRGAPARCPTCGSDVQLMCRHCSTQIPGNRFRVSSSYEPPDFCISCGYPFPWLSRQGLLYELENRLLSGQLDPAEALVVREQLAALADPELDDEEQVRRWQRIARVIPNFWEQSGAKQILVSVMTEYVRSKVGVHDPGK